MLLLRGADRPGLAAALGQAIARLPAADHGEGDLNLVVRYAEGRYRAVLLPRRAHRPGCYFRTGRDQILVSPGAADMAGLLVVTRQADLERLTPPVIRGIYGEVARGGTELGARWPLAEILGP
jgi:hypothetical protein